MAAWFVWNPFYGTWVFTRHQNNEEIVPAQGHIAYNSGVRKKKKKKKGATRIHQNIRTCAQFFLQ